MTLEEMHTMFDVELDKLNGTSYPSFLPEEKDLWLNKAYLMLINQKFTGDNKLGLSFEMGTKRISDLQALIKTNYIELDEFNYGYQAFYNLNTSNRILYIISAVIDLFPSTGDGKHNFLPVKIVSHDIAAKFLSNKHNTPWIKDPIAVIENNRIAVFVDPIEYSDFNTGKNNNLEIKYITYPKEFDSSIDTGNDNKTGLKDSPEISEHVHQEIVSLAVYLAIENIQSARVQTNVQPLSIQE